MASVCVASSVIAAAPSVATVESPSLLSARVVAPSWLSGVYGHSVVSVPALATKHVTVARPGHVAVERLNVGSIPSVSVVNEPTTIVTPGKPIRGHSYTSEVSIDKDSFDEENSIQRLIIRSDTTREWPLRSSLHIRLRSSTKLRPRK